MKLISYCCHCPVLYPVDVINAAFGNVHDKPGHQHSYLEQPSEKYWSCVKEYRSSQQIYVRTDISCVGT